MVDEWNCGDSVVVAFNIKTKSGNPLPLSNLTGKVIDPHGYSIPIAPACKWKEENGSGELLLSKMMSGLPGEYNCIVNLEFPDGSSQSQTYKYVVNSLLVKEDEEDSSYFPDISFDVDTSRVDELLDSIHFDEETYGDDWEASEDPDDDDSAEEIEEEVDEGYAELAKAWGQDIPLSAKAIIYNNQMEILILADNMNMEGFWDLPGGHVMDGESTEQALTREVKEETQLDITEVDELFTRELELGGEKKAVIFFIAKVAGDYVTLSHEHKEYAWVTYEESQHYNLGVFQEVLDEALKQSHYHGGIVAFPVPEE